MSVQRKDFLSNPHSKDIRDICLNMLAAFEALLYGTESIKAQAYAQLERCNGMLIELEITPEMKTGLPEEAYNDPVTAAQYLAGQLIEQLEHISPSQSKVIRSVEEWSETTQENIHLLSTNSSPSDVHKFIVHQQVITTIANLFDRSKEELEERKWQ